MKRATVAVFVLLLTACATPAQVAEGHRLAEERYTEDLATAVEWNVHTLGIPASGWVAIWICGALVAGIVAVIGMFYLSEARTERRKDRHRLEMERERTRQVAAERGSCPTCGTPAIDMADRAGQEA